MDIKYKHIYERFIMTLFALVFIESAGAAFSPLWAHFTNNIGGNLKTAGIALAILHVVKGATCVIAAFFQDIHKNYKIPILISVLLSSVTWLLFVHITSKEELYIIVALMGISSGMLWPGFHVLFTHTHIQGREAFSWGIYETVYALSGGLGVIIGSHVVHHLSYQVLFIILSFMNAVAFFIFLILFKIQKEQEASLNESSNS